MSSKKKKGGSGKVRVSFKRNRNGKTRDGDWTRRYREGLTDRSDEGADVADAESGERVVARGDVVRKRTIVGSFVGEENLSGEVGDFEYVPDVDESVCLKGRVLSVHGLYSYVEDEQGRVFTCVTRRVLKTISTNQRQIVVAGDDRARRTALRDAQSHELEPQARRRRERRAGADYRERRRTAAQTESRRSASRHLRTFRRKADYLRQ